MYVIWTVDGEILYDPTREDTKLQAPTILSEVNKIGSLTFTAYPDNALFDSLGLMSKNSYLYVARFRNNFSDWIFAARPRQVTRMMDGGKSFRCEELTGLLNDVMWPPQTFTGTPAQLMQNILGVYNAGRADADKFAFIESLVPQDTITVENNDYIGCYDALITFLVGAAGGIVLPVYSSHNQMPGLRHIPDTAMPGNYSGQNVSVGSNVISASLDIKTDDFFTALLPLGASKNGSEVTIESVNSGSKVLVDADLEVIHGRIERKVRFDSIDNAADLKAAAQALMPGAGAFNRRVKAQIFDLSAVDPDEEPFELGKYAVTELDPIGASGGYLIGKMTVALGEPKNSRMEFGLPRGAITDSISANDGATRQAIININNRLSQ